MSKCKCQRCMNKRLAESLEKESEWMNWQRT